MEEYNFTAIIIATTVGFFSLAFVLLFPVYRFLRREERAATSWTPDAIAKRQRRQPQVSGDGAPGRPPTPSGADTSEAPPV